MAPRRNAETKPGTGKVAATTMLKNPDGVLVKIKQGDECPEWAVGRVPVVANGDVAETETAPVTEPEG